VDGIVEHLSRTAAVRVRLHHGGLLGVLLHRDDAMPATVPDERSRPPAVRIRDHQLVVPPHDELRPLEPGRGDRGPDVDGGAVLVAALASADAGGDQGGG
jgi:hypothetical protein